jgi:aryl-alcohol dehydrogenase-like predicted oxidoreductase
VDIYMMHRDNPDIPAGEFIDVLNEHKRKGRMRAFGGSNWTAERIEQANAYAKARGLDGFAAVSNNLSLARMVEPVWAGCLHMSDARSRRWLERTGIVIMPWSSQARGFFTDRADPGAQPEPELERCWYAEDNFKRRGRAYEMARRLGVQPVQIALAYVLCQPFPAFPLIGPRTIRELRSCLDAVKIRLTPEDLAWLWGEEG